MSECNSLRNRSLAPRVNQIVDLFVYQKLKQSSLQEAREGVRLGGLFKYYRHAA